MNYIEKTLNFLISEIKGKIENNKLVCYEIYKPECGQHLIYLKRIEDLDNDMSAVSISFSKIGIGIIYRDKNKSKYYTGNELKIYKEYPSENTLSEVSEVEEMCQKHLKENKLKNGNG